MLFSQREHCTLCLGSNLKIVLVHIFLYTHYMSIFVADDSISHTKPFKNNCCSLWLKILSANQKFKVILLTVQKHMQTHQPQFALFAKNITSVYIEGKLHSVFSFTQAITLRWPLLSAAPTCLHRNHFNLALPTTVGKQSTDGYAIYYSSGDALSSVLWTRQSDNTLVKNRWVCIPQTLC